MKTPTTLLQKFHIIRPPKHVNVDDHVEDCYIPDERRLPPEIIIEIIGYLLEERDRSPARANFIKHTLQPTLRSAVLISKAWTDAVEEYLYKEIYISSSKALQALADTLWTGSGSRLRPYVTQFHFTGKAFGSGTFPTQYTAKDAFNQWCILSLCPNLQPILQSKPWAEKVNYINDDQALPAFFLSNAVPVDRVTHLEITLQNDAFLDGKLAFLSDIEFTALQALHILFTHPLFDREPEDSDEITLLTPQWFKMPQLRCLRLEDLRLRKRHCNSLTFPEHSPLVNTIELLDGCYACTDSLFEPLTSPLRRYANVLESLTLTALHGGYTHVVFPCWSLHFLKNLRELCVLGICYAMTQILTYPPHLQHLALAPTGLDMRDAPRRVVWAFNGVLSKSYKIKLSGSGLQELKRVSFLLVRPSVDRRSIQFQMPPGLVDANLANVEETFGIDGLYDYRNLKSDKTAIKKKLRKDMKDMKRLMPELVAKLPSL